MAATASDEGGMRTTPGAVAQIIWLTAAQLAVAGRARPGRGTAARAAGGGVAGRSGDEGATAGRSGGRMRRPPRILRWQGSKEEPGIACGRAATRIATPKPAPGSTPDYTRAAVQKGATGPGRNAKPPGFPGVICYFLQFDGDIFRGQLPAGGDWPGHFRWPCAARASQERKGRDLSIINYRRADPIPPRQAGGLTWPAMVL